jgi:alcohol dehydrogenase/L-iditol 2-dehydrogenase
VRRQLTLQGSLTYDHPTDFAATVSEIRAGRFGAGRIVTDEYPLAEAQEALELSSEARGKTWLRIDRLN